MSRTKSSGVPGRASNKIEDTIYRVLLFEDDEARVDATTDYLRTGAKTINVHVGRNKDEASRLLQQYVFDAVLVDILIELGNTFELGDDWLLSEQDRTYSALRAIVTAYPNRIIHSEFIKRERIPVIVKSEPEEKQLYDDIIKAAQTKAARAGGEPDPGEESGVSPRADGSKGPTGEKLVQIVRETFLDYLHSISEAGDDQSGVEGVHLGEKSHTVTSLINEVEANSEEGQRWLEMFARHVRRKLGTGSRRQRQKD